MNADRMRLIGEEDAVAMGARVTVVKPDFRLLPNADLLEAAAASQNPEEVLKDERVLTALLSAIRTATRPEVAAWCATLLIDGGKLDTSNWNLIANCPGVLGVDAAFTAFSQQWKAPVANDALAFIIASCMNYNPGTVDTRPLFKQIIDPTLDTLTACGRLAAISNLLRLDNLRFDLANSSTLRSVIANGFGNQNAECVYYACLCLWQLTYNTRVVDQILYTHRSILRAFLGAFQVWKKEKIIRASLMILHNMMDYIDMKENQSDNKGASRTRLHTHSVSHANTLENGQGHKGGRGDGDAEDDDDDWLLNVLIQSKVSNRLTALPYEKFKDEEIYENINKILSKINGKNNSKNSFKKYIKELNKKRFINVNLHNEKFWIENSQKFEDNEYQPIKELASLIIHAAPGNSPSPDGVDVQTLSLAIFDIGEFARFYPTGKQLVAKFGAKKAIMDMMSSPVKEIARAALLTTQKLMLDNWKAMQKED